MPNATIVPASPPRRMPELPEVEARGRVPSGRARRRSSTSGVRTIYLSSTHPGARWRARCSAAASGGVRPRLSASATCLTAELDGRRWPHARHDRAASGAGDTRTGGWSPTATVAGRIDSPRCREARSRFDEGGQEWASCRGAPPAGRAGASSPAACEAPIARLDACRSRSVNAGAWLVPAGGASRAHRPRTARGASAPRDAPEDDRIVAHQNVDDAPAAANPLGRHGAPPRLGSSGIRRGARPGTIWRSASGETPRRGADLHRAAAAAEDEPVEAHEPLVDVTAACRAAARTRSRRRSSCRSTPASPRRRERDPGRPHEAAHGVVDVEPRGGQHDARAVQLRLFLLAHDDGWRSSRADATSRRTARCRRRGSIGITVGDAGRRATRDAHVASLAASLLIGPPRTPCPAPAPARPAPATARDNRRHRRLRVGPSSPRRDLPGDTQRRGRPAEDVQAALDGFGAASSVDHWRRARSIACAVMRRPSVARARADGRHRGACASGRAAARPTIHDLHHHAKRILGMQERLLPARRSRFRDDAVTERGACARSRAGSATLNVTWWMPHRARPESGAGSRRRRAARDLDAAARRRTPTAKRRRRRTFRRRRPAEHAHQIRRRVGDTCTAMAIDRAGSQDISEGVYAIDMKTRLGSSGGRDRVRGRRAAHEGGTRRHADRPWPTWSDASAGLRLTAPARSHIAVKALHLHERSPSRSRSTSSSSPSSPMTPTGHAARGAI